MRPGETLAYLEMTGPAELRPGRADPELAVRQTSDAALVRTMTLAIGAPYAWPTQLWDERAWRDYAADSTVRHWTAQRSGAVIGLASVRFGAGEIELDTFGLVPQWVGRELGGPFLTDVVRVVWSQAPSARRLWLRTSDQDSAHALANYTARGFRIVRMVRGEP